VQPGGVVLLDDEARLALAPPRALRGAGSAVLPKSRLRSYSLSFAIGPAPTVPARAPGYLRRVIPSDEQILRAIVDLGDDGFVPRHQLVLRFRNQGERDMRRAIGRTARRGLLLERRDPEGRSFVAVSTEGWQALRSGEFEPRRLRRREE
jgi:hypothetical protein